MFLKEIWNCENFATECKHRGSDSDDGDDWGGCDGGYHGGGGDAGGGSGDEWLFYGTNSTGGTRQVRQVWECLSDLCESGVKDDNLVLLYNVNKNVKVAVKTPVGRTARKAYSMWSHKGTFLVQSCAATK